MDIKWLRKDLSIIQYKINDLNFYIFILENINNFKYIYIINSLI